MHHSSTFHFSASVATLCLILKIIPVIQSSCEKPYPKPTPWNQAARQKWKLSHQSRDGQTTSGPDLLFGVRRKAPRHMPQRMTGHRCAIAGLGLWDSGKDFHVGAPRKRKDASKLELLRWTSHGTCSHPKGFWEILAHPLHCYSVTASWDRG